MSEQEMLALKERADLVSEILSATDPNAEFDSDMLQTGFEQLGAETQQAARKALIAAFTQYESAE